MAKYAFRIFLALLMLTPLTSRAYLNYPVEKIDGVEYYIYEVPQGQTIYSLTRLFGISQDDLIKHNPSVADGLQAFTTVYIPVNRCVTPETMVKTHKVEKGQTIYGICKTYGITEDELKAANPHLTDGLKSGSTIIIPAHSEAATNDSPVTEIEIDNTPRATTMPVADLSEPVEPSTSDDVIRFDYNSQLEEEMQEPSYSIVVALPFMLKEEKPDKKTRTYLDFYRGLLIAADTLNRANQDAIRIIALDTEGSLNRVKEIAQMPEVMDATVIIAPDDPAQMSVLASLASDDEGPYIFNIFNVKDETWQRKPHILQANIKSSDMYDLAYRGISHLLDDHEVVFIFNTDEKARNEKVDFTTHMQGLLDAGHNRWRSLKYNGRLTAADLSSLAPSGRYIFIPTSGSAAEFDKFQPALTKFQDAALTAGGDVRVFGYPDWVTFRNERFNDMCRLNASIYSRFYNKEDNFSSQNFANVYRRWYGNEMLEGVPSQALQGFDVGRFLITSLRHLRGNLSRSIPGFEGVQSAYYFPAQVDGRGVQNISLYIVTFNPDKSVTKRVITK